MWSSNGKCLSMQQEKKVAFGFWLSCYDYK